MHSSSSSSVPSAVQATAGRWPLQHPFHSILFFDIHVTLAAFAILPCHLLDDLPVILLFRMSVLNFFHPSIILHSTYVSYPRPFHHINFFHNVLYSCVFMHFAGIDIFVFRSGIALRISIPLTPRTSSCFKICCVAWLIYNCSLIVLALEFHFLQSMIVYRKSVLIIYKSLCLILSSLEEQASLLAARMIGVMLSQCDSSEKGL